MLYNNEDCEVICANETGRTILDKLDGKKTINEIIVEISVEYDLPETVVEEYINDFIEHLAMNKIVLDKQDDTKELKKILVELIVSILKWLLLLQKEVCKSFKRYLAKFLFIPKRKKSNCF